MRELLEGEEEMILLVVFGSSGKLNSYFHRCTATTN